MCTLFYYLVLSCNCLDCKCCREAYEDAARKKSNQAKPDLPEFEIPSNFICPICNEIMTDAVKTSCCATHFCDSCKFYSSQSNFLLC